MPESPVPGPLTGVLAGFARDLRRAGVCAGTGDVLTYVAAATALDPSDLVDLYWAGRATLISRAADIAVYDQVFRRYFLGQGTAGAPAGPQPKPGSGTGTEDPFGISDVDLLGGEEEREEQALGLMASSLDTLKHRSFAACTPEELAALRRIMARIRLTPPRRRTRRHRAASSGQGLDIRAMARESMRAHGEIPEPYFRQRKNKLRPLILILDVSGSMAEYSRHLLQFAHTARHAVSSSKSARVEVFCFGTRLTRITRDLDPRRPDAALERAAKTVVDWDGGTRIGESLQAFLRRYGRGGLTRGAVVVICSDGLDRGSPATLETAMERMRRLCYRIVWVNPHPSHTALGMVAATPHIDLLLSGHDLASLEELAGALEHTR